MRPTLPPTVQTAIEDTVGLKQGSKNWELLAARLQLSEGVLRNKVAPEKEDKRHHLSLAEAIEMVKATQNHALIYALCKEFGGGFLPHPELKGASDDELLSRYTKMMKELGQFSTDIHESLADGKITQNEIGALRKDFLRLSGALSEIMDRLQDRANCDRPAKSGASPTRKLRTVQDAL